MSASHIANLAIVRSVHDWDTYEFYSQRVSYYLLGTCEAFTRLADTLRSIDERETGHLLRVGDGPRERSLVVGIVREAVLPFAFVAERFRSSRTGQVCPQLVVGGTREALNGIAADMEDIATDPPEPGQHGDWFTLDEFSSKWILPGSTTIKLVYPVVDASSGWPLLYEQLWSEEALDGVDAGRSDEPVEALDVNQHPFAWILRGHR
jgi:hypothetical protein